MSRIFYIKLNAMDRNDIRDFTLGCLDTFGNVKVDLDGVWLTPTIDLYGNRLSDKSEAELCPVAQVYVTEECDGDFLESWNVLATVHISDTRDSRVVIQPREPENYTGNMPCDTYGMCAGASCSRYFHCR